MRHDWIREEWLAARRAAEVTPHPPDCTCRGCALAEVGPPEEDE